MQKKFGRNWWAIVAALSVALAGCWVDRSEKPAPAPAPTVSPFPPVTETPVPPLPPLADMYRPDLEKFHEKCVNVFVSQPGFGFSRLGPLHSPGAFPATLTLAAPTSSLRPPAAPAPAGESPAAPAEEKATWQVAKLELVGATFHKPPKAYAMPKPGTRPLGRAPLRELNEFEKESLEALQAGKDVQIHAEAEQITMVGAIRAGAKCVQCHTNEKTPIKEGHLLGAFTYVLKPAPK
jgi:hypothetical protein